MADRRLRRRRTDRGWRRLLRENWYRDVWLVLTTIIALTGVALAVAGSHKAQVAAVQAKQAVQKQREGRRVAIGVTCAALSAVSRAGRDVIAGSSSRPISARQEHALEALGFPPLREREKAAESQADAYVRSISDAVDRQIGHVGDRLVLPGGPLDCHELERLADALH